MSARVRLTLSYAALAVASGVAVLVIALSVLRFVPVGNLSSGPTLSSDPATPGPPGRFVPDRNDLLEVLLPRAGVTLLLLALFALVAGWFLAGRMLRPLQEIHAVAERVAAGSLEPRVRASGRHDEFRLLADTFDGMLDRVEADLAEQRRYAANASHELRTPYAISRTLIDVALADPGGRDIDQILHRLDETNRRGLDVVEALLALSSIDAGVALARAPVDLAEVTTAVLADARPSAEAAGIVVDAQIGEGDLDGHPVLVRQLVSNLVLNAIRHNVGPGGTVAVQTTTTDDGHVELHVANSGPVIDPGLVDQLTEPFVRGAGRVAVPDDGAAAPRGSGLGLAIVARVAEAHGAELTIAAPATGGLDVRVRFQGP